jgi:hypothetical protein
MGAGIKVETVNNATSTDSPSFPKCTPHLFLEVLSARPTAFYNIRKTEGGENHRHKERAQDNEYDDIYYQP